MLKASTDKIKVIRVANSEATGTQGTGEEFVSFVPAERRGVERSEDFRSAPFGAEDLGIGSESTGTGDATGLEVTEVGFGFNENVTKVLQEWVGGRATSEAKKLWRFDIINLLVPRSIQRTPKQTHVV